MPELPDVEAYRRYCQKKIIDKKIDKVKAEKGRVLQTSLQTLKKHLEGSSFAGTSRHGKYLFLALEGKELMLHFGMTGDVEYSKEKKDFEHAPLMIDFTDGSRFAFINIRKLGKAELVDSRQAFVEKKKLGPDAYIISSSDLKEAMRGRAGIKSALMDQKKIAGIGNIYSDEILYQSYVHPSRAVSNLKNKEIESMHTNMQRVIKVCVRHDADPNKFPERYLTKRREEGKSCGICSGTIRKKTINGRSSYFCSRHQK